MGRGHGSTFSTATWHMLVVGRSPIVGAPMVHVFCQAGAMVTSAHTDVDKMAFMGELDIYPCEFE